MKKTLKVKSNFLLEGMMRWQTIEMKPQVNT